MGVMQQMRNLASWFILGVGGLFVLFMVLSDSNLSQIVGQQSNVVGTVNGKDITYQEFSQTVEQFRANQLQQTGQEIDENQMGLFRDQVWDNLVSQKLVADKIEELGIQVTDDEIRDVITGPNPPAFLTQNFMDSTGAFNRAAYDDAIMNPENETAIIQAEEYVRQQKINEKLMSYVNASVIVFQSEIYNSFVDRNITISADFAVVKNTTIADTDIPVTDEDVKKYYDNNLELFKVDAQRKIKYVIFRKQAAAADTNNIKKNFESIMKKINADSESFKTYVEIYSTQPYKVDTLAITAIESEVQAAVADAEDGELIGPALTRRGYVIYKKSGEVKSKDEFVRASHILIKTKPGEEDAAKKKADEIYTRLRSGENFEQLAKAVSEDGSASRGGDLGWFGKGQMVEEFEKASFRGRIGVIQRPVKTSFGYHIIKTTGKSKAKYIVEKIIKPVEASPTTVDKIYNRAGDFSYLADKYGWDKTVEDEGLMALESTGFAEDARTIPGVGQNSSLQKWVYQAGLGDISEVFRINAGYVVAMVSDISKPGFKDFESVKSICRMNFIRDAKKAKAFELAEQIKAKVAQTGNLEDAKSVYDKVEINKAENFTRSGNISKVGRDFSFGDFALNAPLNTVAGPVKGTAGAYVMKVTNRTEVDSSRFAVQKTMLSSQLLQRKKANYFQQWILNLKEEADIEDRRFNFFR